MIGLILRVFGFPCLFNLKVRVLCGFWGQVGKSSLRSDKKW